MPDQRTASPAQAPTLDPGAAAVHVRRIARQDRLATGILTIIVALVLVLLAAIVGYILVNGAGKLFDLSFLTSKPEQFRAGGGIGPELFNSFYLLLLTLLISVPISLGAAIFLAEYAPDNVVTVAAKTAIETLSSLPSIVVGLFGFLFFVLQMGWGFSILSGALALTMFNIPILERTIQQALEDVPRTQRDAGLALGLTKWETTIHVLVPAAMPAIVTGVVLSAGRVFGEAAALIYTAGQSAPALDFGCLDLTSPTCPWNLFRPAETLAVHIWKINSEGVVPDLSAVSNGTAAVLMVCILVFNLVARGAGKAIARRLTAE
ncbi:MAG: phosphate ABC transporter permease PstA [Atopobiaceae bacterium]|jgi:phosphate transport system permease protein|nr:phosphate ABC transporter permease PstA [Atopobiaceae bacterium]MCH4181022.1 phosphate ABC transporter permease PstA [Atopobiaceae bacterium]MCH4214934.1 phosphate ABC transporter permease PstA [Atopobiaceae bacterium]MCH4229738.1 phosphate ABC transporter permease PstA [Atopobiaceae bacterium]MCH4276065.1 phosphate ABC transporter permease PstA [Atopobiaceae bacterium]